MRRIHQLRASWQGTTKWCSFPRYINYHYEDYVEAELKLEGNLGLAQTRKQWLAADPRSLLIRRDEMTGRNYYVPESPMVIPYTRNRRRSWRSV